MRILVEVGYGLLVALTLGLYGALAYYWFLEIRDGIKKLVGGNK